MYKCIYMYTFIYIYRNVYTYMGTSRPSSHSLATQAECEPVYICIYTHMYIHIHMYIYIYTHIYGDRALHHTLWPHRQSANRYIYVYIHIYTYIYTKIYIHIHIQPIADRVAQHLKINFKTFSTNQNSAHGICDWYHKVNDQSHENSGTP